MRCVWASTDSMAACPVRERAAMRRASSPSAGSQHLAENAGYSYHGGGGPPYDSRRATQTVAEFYPRRSKPNLDKSGSGEKANVFWAGSIRGDVKQKHSSL